MVHLIQLFKSLSKPVPEPSVLLWSALVALFLEFFPIHVPFLGISLGIPAWGLVFYLALKFVLGDIRQLLLKLAKSSPFKRFGPMVLLIVSAIGLCLGTDVGEVLYGPIGRAGIEPGSFAEWIGGVGQLVLASGAIVIANNQNRISETQTVDSCIQGLQEMLINDDELRPSVHEAVFGKARIIAVGGELTPTTLAKLLRFGSAAKLFWPYKLDTRSSKLCADGNGHYEYDFVAGLILLELGSILARKVFDGQQLSEVAFYRHNLQGASFVRAELRHSSFLSAYLDGVDLSWTDLTTVQFFKGPAPSPAVINIIPGEGVCYQPPNPETGEQFGAIVTNLKLTGSLITQAQADYLRNYGGPATVQQLSQARIVG